MLRHLPGRRFAPIGGRLDRNTWTTWPEYAILRCPVRHQRSIRTTNLLERAFQESRRRTKVIPHFFTERACLKLVFSALWKTSQRWRAVTTTELDRQPLALLRQEPGLPLYPGQEPHRHH